MIDCKFCGQYTGKDLIYCCTGSVYYRECSCNGKAVNDPEDYICDDCKEEEQYDD